MPRPRRLPAPYDSGAFAVRDAKGDKVPMSSVRALVNPFRGVRAHEAPETIAERFAMLELVRPGMTLSHCTAALVHGLPVMTLADTWIDLAPFVGLADLVVLGTRSRSGWAASTPAT